MVRSHLERLGREPDKVLRTLEEMTGHPPDEPFRVSSELTVVNRSVSESELGQALDGPLLHELLMPVVAYRFLAAVVREAVFTPSLDGLRRWLIGEAEKPAYAQVRQGFLNMSKRSPIHGIAVSHADDGHVIVRVVLFGSIAADVHLTSMAAPVEVAYQLDLRTGEDDWSFTPHVVA